MDYQKYMSLVETKKFDEAVKYKCDSIPDTLYKYYGLNKDKKLNESKLNFLEQKKIYLSDFNSFNDPFEGQFLIFDKSKLEEKGWDRDLVEYFYSQIVQKYKITCLSDTNEQNMPMWAYYANSHQGFCVEYRLTESQKKYVFPVAYEKKRLYANSIITNVINSFEEFRRSGNLEPNTTGETDLYNQLIFLSMAAKHKSWEHENEYRIINPFSNEFPAIPSKIFIGVNCEKENRERLIQIGKSINDICHVYQMSVERDTEAFELNKTRIV
ncbi:MAG: DUF2971 domain-containing protein [Lachnospiraceae bacterium]|nr:DUF2971 domain-containing protein [Lachnospiraceae bacterium]